MTVRQEFAGSTAYGYTPDAPPHAANRWRAIVRARLADEITRDEILDEVSLTCEPTDMVPRAATGGLVGAVGRPEHVLPALALAAADIRLSIATPGYLPIELTGQLGPIAGFPAVFAPLDFGDVLLHRRGVTLTGRIVHNATFTQPISGATVHLEGLWSTLPPPNWTPPALQEAPNIVALAPGLYASRGAGTTFAHRDLALSPQVKTLVAPLVAGDATLVLSDRTGLAVGTVLVIDRDDPMRIEAIEIAAVDASSTPDQPARITLAHPATYLHLDGRPCTAGAPQLPLAPTTLARSGIPGDAVAILAAPPAFAIGDIVEIDDGVSTREFQRIDRFEATSDADGFFRWPPLSRVALARLRVHHAGFNDATPIVTLDYRAAVQRVTVAME